MNHKNEWYWIITIMQCIKKWVNNIWMQSKISFIGKSSVLPWGFYFISSSVWVASSWYNTTPTVLRWRWAGATLQHVHVRGGRVMCTDKPARLPRFNRITEQRSHLAASPPGRRFDTLGLPSLSDPPEMVRPRLLPSRFIRSTVVTPRYSSADRHRGRQRSTALATAWQNHPVWAATKDPPPDFFSESLAEMLSDTQPYTYFLTVLSFPCSLKSLRADESLWWLQRKQKGDESQCCVLLKPFLNTGDRKESDALFNKIKHQLEIENCNRLISSLTEIQFVLKWMKMSLTLPLRDMWLYSAIRGLILSCALVLRC